MFSRDHGSRELPLRDSLQNLPLGTWSPSWKPYLRQWVLVHGDHGPCEYLFTLVSKFPCVKKGNWEISVVKLTPVTPSGRWTVPRAPQPTPAPSVLQVSSSVTWRTADPEELCAPLQFADGKPARRPAKSFSLVRLFATLWTVARQAPLSLGFSRQEYWSGLPCPPPGVLPNSGTEPASPATPGLQADSLPLSHRGNLWKACLTLKVGFAHQGSLACWKQRALRRVQVYKGTFMLGDLRV